MKTLSWMTVVAALAAAASVCGVPSHAGLFKLDFGGLQNSVTLTDWDTLSDWSFKDFPDGIASWNLTDFSAGKNTNVTLTILDNAGLAAQTGVPALGMGSNNPDPQGLDVVYGGINVPAAVKDDYMWHDPDTAGTEVLFRFANLAPGQYHVTVFDGRVSDENGQYGKIWVDDITGKHEPAGQNTGDFSANPLSNPNDPNSPRVPNRWGHPQTLVVDLKAGDYLWYAHMEDGWGGISGMIIRSWVDSDRDGIPDDWETQWGLNPLDPGDAAKDPNGNGLSNLLEYQSALDPIDTTRPTILSVVADSVANEVVVTFSKPLFTGSAVVNDPRDATLATRPANYTISPALGITRVTVEGNVVTLRTAKPNPDLTAYTLTVNNVRDVNNWPVAPNTTVSFSMGATPGSTEPLIYQWFTIAGKAGTPGSTEGTNSAARFNQPNGMTMDKAGNLYVADGGSHIVRQLTPAGTNWVVKTLAGKPGSAGSADGTNSAARFSKPGHVSVDSLGNIYVADWDNYTIRKITLVGTNWVVSTIAGKAGAAGSADGTNSAARFRCNSTAPDGSGGLYVVDSGNHTIRKLSPVGTNWVSSTIAGKAGVAGSAEGTNATIRFNDPVVPALDSAGNLYFTEFDGQRIRKLTLQGTNWVSSPIAGKAGFVGSADGPNSVARFNCPNGIALDSAGALYVANFSGDTIRKITPVGTNWVVSTIGGKAGFAGIANGTNSVARLNQPVGIVVDRLGNLFVTDWGNHTIRKGVPLPAFQGVSPTNDRIELLLTAAPGQTVQLQYSSDLASAPWTNLGNPITASSGTISVTDSPPAGQARFYRALVVTP